MIDNEIRECAKCVLRKGVPEGCTPVPGYGNKSAKLMVVTDQIAWNDMLAGQPLYGIPSKVLNQAGINVENAYYVSVVNCPSEKVNKEIIDTCKEWLWKQIAEIKPTTIILLGWVPTKAILQHIGCKEFGKFVYKRCSIPSLSSKLYPVYHPSYIVQRGKKEYDKYINTLNIIRLECQSINRLR